MPKLTAGELPVDLGGETLILKPTMRAWNAISRQYNGLANARQQIVAENADAVVFILRHGLNLNDQQAKALPERVWQNGMTAELLVPLIKYVAVLGNGGKPLPDEPGDDIGADDGAEDMGNE